MADPTPLTVRPTITGNLVLRLEGGQEIDLGAVTLRANADVTVTVHPSAPEVDYRAR